MNFLEGRPVNTRAQRTGKPYARLLLLSGFTFEALKFKYPAFAEPPVGELLQEFPFEPTAVKEPLVRSR